MALDAQEMEVLMTGFKKVLVIQTAFPGDAILTLPLIQYLNVRLKIETIDVVCNPLTVEIFNASSYVSRTIILDKKEKDKSVFSLFKFAKNLKENSYDAVYSPHRSFRSSLITLFSSVKETFGFDNSSLNFAFKNVIHYDIKDHEVKRNLLLSGNDFENDNWKILPEISIDIEIKNSVSKFIFDNNLKEKFIALAPASLWGTKQYPANQFREIIEYFLGIKEKIVLIGSKNENEFCDTLIKNSNVINAAGKFSYIGSIELLKHCKLLLSNDSAPAHLGMCADIPVLMLYCSTIPGFGFFPYNNKSAFLSYDELTCKPCGIHGYENCPLGTFDCAKNLKPEIVIQKINEMISY